MSKEGALFQQDVDSLFVTYLELIQQLTKTHHSLVTARRLDSRYELCVTREVVHKLRAAGHDVSIVDEKSVSSYVQWTVLFK